MRKIAQFLLLGLLTACSLPGMAAPTATPTAVPPTATPIPPTLTLTPTETGTPTLEPTTSATIMPTIEPMTGIVLAPTNIRSGPGKGGNERLGGLLYNQTVQVIGRDVSAGWLYIIFPDAPGGTAWILGKAVELKGDLTKLPIMVFPAESDQPVMYPPLDYAITGAPLPLNTPPIGAKTGTIVQMTNVRVGPGAGYSVLGVLKPGEVVTLTGRVYENYWVQIDYPSGLDGRAWISTSLLKPADGYGGLPYYNLLGTAIPTGQPNAPTQTPGPRKTSDPKKTPSATFSPTVTKTLFPSETPTRALPTVEGPTGYTKIQVNIRARPVQTSELLGVLEAKTLVLLTGRNLIGNWFQIEYPPNSQGRGWVAAAYIDLKGVSIDKLPYYDNDGTPLPPVSP
jgi:uncharacterized protein YgiM (DUF1202 family)